ncbi:hypothetical protein EKO04_003292 [Ascochyta lentis]|uniref:Uncharacterized protein n=1 Tax=Ascochyta lentis TaxID=205686 RepID=A0A8H7JBA7_9PLEO|nr:hypothetical protein EKO04_003292 [Ascochyta lentis]
MAQQTPSSNASPVQLKDTPSRPSILPSPDDGSGYRPTHIPGVYMRITKMIGLTSVTWLPGNNNTKEEDKVSIGPLASDWSHAADETKYGTNSKYGVNTVDTKIWGGVRVPGVFVKRDEIVGAVVVNWVDRGVETTVHISRQE